MCVKVMGNNKVDEIGRSESGSPSLTMDNNGTDNNSETISDIRSDKKEKKKTEKISKNKTKRPVEWSIKKIRQQNRKSLFNRGRKPYLILCVVAFIFSFVGALNSFASNDINAIDMKLDQGYVDKETIDNANEYILNSTFVSGFDETVKTDFIKPMVEVFFINHSFLVGLFSLNKSYIDRNMGEVVVLLIIISVLIYIITTFVQRTMSVGEYRYLMEFRFQKQVKIRRIFAPFGNKKAWKMFKTMSIYYIVMIFWILTIVGGAIKLFEYIFVPMIVAENPSIRWRDAKRLSKSMTKGYKWKIFCVFLSYFYIIALTVLPLFNTFVCIPILDNALVEMYFVLRRRPDIDKSFFIEKAFDEKSYIERIEAGEKSEDIVPEYVMKDIHIKGSDFDENDKYKLTEFIFMFFLFSFVGWIWEVGLHVYKDHAFVNRGTMYGPWLPIYGAGGAFIIVLLSRFKKKKATLFVLTMALCGVLEYITSFVLDFVENAEYWNYDDMFANFNGRVCLAGLVAFALGGFLGVYILGPLIKRFVERIGRTPTLIICTICVTAFLIDIVCCKIFGPNSGEGIGTKLGMLCDLIKLC